MPRNFRLPTLLRASAHVCKHRHRLSSNQLFVRYRKSSVPEGGWTDETFRGRAADALIEDFINIRRQAVARGTRAMIPDLTKWFNQLTEDIIATATDGWRRLYGIPLGAQLGGKETIIIDDIDAHETMWAQAIEQELARAGATAQVIIEPHITSVGDEVFGKIGIALGYDATPEDVRLHRVRMANRVSQVTRINDTTRTRLTNTISDSIRRGDPPFTVADKIRKRMPEIQANRAATIARTELGQSADDATLFMMSQSGTVTHVTVFGCETIDRDGPHFDGIPTCNIINVPIEREAELEFHISRTGSIIPAAFRREDGSVPELYTQPGRPYDT